MNRHPVSNRPPTVTLAIMLLLVMGAAFVGLISIIIPGAIQMVGVMVVLFLFFVAQYFIWGKWLYPYVVKLDAARTTETSIDHDSVAAESPDDSGIK